MLVFIDLFVLLFVAALIVALAGECVVSAFAVMGLSDWLRDLRRMVSIIAFGGLLIVCVFGVYVVAFTLYMRAWANETGLVSALIFCICGALVAYWQLATAAKSAGEPAF